MIRRRVPLALLASGLLTLAACTPAARSSRSSPAPVPVTALSAPPGQVTLGLFAEVFSTPPPPDPAQARVIANFRQAMTLWDKSTEAVTMVSPVTSYVTGSALGNIRKVLSIETQGHFIPYGVDTLFLTRATVLGSGTATVTSCEDSSKYTTIDTRTWAIAPVVPKDQQYLQATFGMTMISGHWAIDSVKVATLPAAAAKPCQP